MLQHPLVQWPHADPFTENRLIPKQREGRDALIGELLRVEVNIAAEIVQKYTFEYGGRSFSGADGPGEVALSAQEGRLQIFMTRENISAFAPPPELGNVVCDRYGIVDPVHRNLVHFALREDSPQRLSSTFTREGIHVLAGGIQHDKFVTTAIS